MSLAAVFAAAGTLATPAAAVTAARVLDSATAGTLLDEGLAFAAAHPALRELTRAIDGNAAMNRGTDGRLTILLLGSDYRPKVSGERTDSIMVMTINPKTKQMAAVSIPRDIARVKLPNGATYRGRINELYAYYRKGRGAAGALAEVERIIEYNLQIEIDYYALIRMPGFESLIDHVGGINVSIPKQVADPNFWDDPKRPQGIYFPASPSWYIKGATTLCNGYYKTGQLSKPGAKCGRALVYARTRKGRGNSDFKRARRQHDVVVAAIHKVRVRGSGNLSALLSAANGQIGKNNLITNIPLTSGNALELYNLFGGASLGNRAVLKPKKYAMRISGTATFSLKLAEVRALTKVWFGKVN